MRRRRLVLVAAAALLAASPARAAIQGSPHDLITHGYDAVRTSAAQERCSRCHLSNPPSGPTLRDVLPEVPAVLASSYGYPSLVCFSCHDGTTIVSPNVDATRTAFHPRSHGTHLAGYGQLSSDVVGLPYLSGAHMECVTCHDPHDSTRRPFLRVGLEELCLTCHASYVGYGRGAANQTGNHILAPEPLGAAPAGVVLDVTEPFRTPFPIPFPQARGKDPGAWHWNLGGHLGQGDTGAMGCTTCHAVHGDEATVPAEKLLAVEPVNDVANLFCEGCHAGARGDALPEPPHPNPGGTRTGRTYHPVDDDQSNGEGDYLETRKPEGWPFGGGVPARLICTTCHMTHGARPATALLRQASQPVGFCEECHDTVPDFHHKIENFEDTGCYALLPAGARGSARHMDCAGCHRAHNAGLGTPREEDFIPLLLSPARTGELCARCHPSENPTCATNENYRASHFLGDPLSEYDYPTDIPPPLREDPWPESGLTSYYAGPDRRIVTCFSCHAFKPGVLVADPSGKAIHLLARSGNLVEWADGAESVYLCTGCHSVNPKTGEVKGHSHPMMKADAEKLGRPVDLPATVTPAKKVNCDSCHRPHGAITKSGYYILELVEGTNTDPKALQPPVDYTTLCYLCHDKGKY